LSKDGKWKYPPLSSKESDWVPWASKTFNDISSIARESTSENTEDIKWFHSMGQELKEASHNPWEMDIGMRCKSVKDKSTVDGVRWRDIEVLGEHTEQRQINEKWYQISDYARHALMNQPDRQFIFGIVAHTTRSRPWHIYVAIFLSSCLVSSAAINIISQPMDIIRLIARLASLTLQQRGRDPVFNRRWYKEPLATSYNYHLDFECPKFTAKAIGHISRSTSIIGRRTQVFCARS